jgi:hypothetical protein
MALRGGSATLKEKMGVAETTSKSLGGGHGQDLLKWLAEKPMWKKMSGIDHFLVAGRISWDFKRQTDEASNWGSKFRFPGESKNITMLFFESSSWKLFL